MALSVDDLAVRSVQAVVGARDWIDGGAHDTWRRRRIGVADVGFISSLVDTLGVQVLVFNFSFIIFDVRLWIPLARVQLLLHRLREHLGSLLALHAAGQGLAAGDVLLLAEVHQIRIVNEYLERGPAHLDVVVYVLLQDDWLANLNKGPKLRFVIFYVELAICITVNTSMESRYRDISHSNVCIMTSTNPNVVTITHVNNVHNPNVLQSHTLENNEVFLRQFILEDFNWLTHPLVLFLAKSLIVSNDRSIRKNLTWKALLAQLTFQRLPAVSLHALTFLLRPLGVEPLAKAL